METVTNHEIERRFKAHPPIGDMLLRFGVIKEYGKQLAFIINKNCPDCREKSIALEKIDAAVSFAIMAIERRE